MNKFSILNNKKRWLFTILVFSFLYTQAQCPTIPASPVTICDASGFTYADLNIYATDVSGNGISWYTASTGGSLLPPTNLVSQGTYYADNNSGNCGTRNPIVVNFTIPPTNQNLSYVKCTNDNKTGQDYL